MGYGSGRNQRGNQVEAVSVTNRKTGEKKDLAVNGIFIAVGITPNSELVSGKLEMDAQGYIKAQEDGVTSVEGVYAAGDVRTKQLRQILTAASDGANCVTSVQNHLLYPDRGTPESRFYGLRSMCAGLGGTVTYSKCTKNAGKNWSVRCRRKLPHNFPTYYEQVIHSGNSWKSLKSKVIHGVIHIVHRKTLVFHRFT